MADWLHTDPAAGPATGFAGAAGDIEFQTHGTRVNTWEGWREMRLGIFAKRQRDQPATAAAWDRRRLSARTPGGRSPPWRRPRSSGRLGIREAAAVTVLGDGADRIWRQTAKQLLIGRRMKQTGVRWRVRRANRMAALCGSFHSATWNPYWQHRLI